MRDKHDLGVASDCTLVTIEEGKNYSLRAVRTFWSLLGASEPASILRWWCVCVCVCGVYVVGVCVVGMCVGGVCVVGGVLVVWMSVGCNNKTVIYYDDTLLG